MKIFISWSGERSQALATALREWFPLVLHFVEPWLSQSDIEAGERWSIEVAKELESCNFGIICVTRENLASPWILFEAGALAKSMQDGRVIPLLLDLDFKEISGPLSQFQAKKVDVVGIRELTASLNKTSSTPVPDSQLEKLFGALWADLERNVTSIPKPIGGGKHARPQGEILEELVSSVRSVEMRVRDVVDDDLNIRKRRRNRIPPGMLNDLAHRISDSLNDPIQVLVLASVFKEDLPWVYELASEAYRALRSGPTREGRNSLRRLLRVIDLLHKIPFFDEIGVDRSTSKMLRGDLFELRDMLRFRIDELDQSIRSIIRKSPDEQKEE